MKDKLLHLAPSIMKKEIQCLVNPLGGFILHLGILLQPIYWVTQKATIIDRVQSKKGF